MAETYNAPSIDEYLRKRLMPVEGAIPHLQGIEMYGNSIPAGTVGGDLFEYINFQQRYDIEARIQRALKRSKEYLEPLAAGTAPRNSVDDHVEWLKSRPSYKPEMENEYRAARSSEQVRLALSVTARNALGRSEKESAQEIATMLYGEVRPYGYFRFVNFGHPPPLVFSAEYRKFMDIGKSGMVHFLPLGLQIAEDDPDRNRYFSLEPRERRANSSDVAELTLMSPGDIIFLYTDGVYDGSDKEERRQLENVMREHNQLPPKDICKALLEYAQKRDERLRQIGEQDRIDDKTVFIIKRN